MTPTHLGRTSSRRSVRRPIGREQAHNPARDPDRGEAPSGARQDEVPQPPERGKLS